jgi:membrane associated rhomboid family serine protease
VIGSVAVNSTAATYITTMSIQLAVTLGVLAASAGTTGAMVLLEKRPRRSLNPRLIPTTPILIIAGFVMVLAVVHLVNLLGVHTGRLH